MHENREISSAPWFCDQGRSEKAINRNADMHVLEKSDCAIVPVNQPNNEGKPSDLEISSAPWFCDQGRSEKAINRNADMHVLEKSDCAIVPVNQPNNEGKP